MTALFQACVLNTFIYGSPKVKGSSEESQEEEKILTFLKEQKPHKIFNSKLTAATLIILTVERNASRLLVPLIRPQTHKPRDHLATTGH